MAGLEAAQQFVQRGHHLSRQSCRDDVLVFAAGGENRRELLFLLDDEEAVGRKQHVEGGEDRPSCDLGHFWDTEGKEATRFTAWRVDQANRLLVDEQSDRDFRFTQQALKRA